MGKLWVVWVFFCSQISTSQICALLNQVQGSTAQDLILLSLLELPDCIHNCLNLGLLFIKNPHFLAQKHVQLPSKDVLTH